MGGPGERGQDMARRVRRPDSEYSSSEEEHRRERANKRYKNNVPFEQPQRFPDYEGAAAGNQYGDTAGIRSGTRRDAPILCSPPRMYYRGSDHQLARDPLQHDPYQERTHTSAAGFSPYRPAGTHTVGRSPSRTTQDYFQAYERQGFRSQQDDARGLSGAAPYEPIRRYPAPPGAGLPSERGGPYGHQTYQGGTGGYENMYAMASAAANTQTTSQPESWDLVTLKKGQPDSYLFLCCMLFMRVPQFEGLHVDPSGDPRGNSRVLECDKNFPAHLGQTFRREFLAEKDSVKAQLWLATQAHTFLNYTRNQTIAPQLSFDRFPAQTVEAFRSGIWRCCDSAHRETPSAKHFSAFSILSLLPGSNEQPLFPAAGLSWKQGVSAFESLFWLLALGSSIGAIGRHIPTAHVIAATPLLRTLQKFILLLRRNEDSGHLSVAAAWEQDPPYSQLAVAYTILRDIDQLLDLFLRWARPPGGAPPVVLVLEHIQGARPEAAVTARFTKQASPLDPLSEDCDDTIFAALATWENEKTAYYTNGLPRQTASQLTPAPRNYVSGGGGQRQQQQGHLRGYEAPANEKRRGEKQGKQHNEVAPKNFAAAPEPTKAAKPLIQWGPDATAAIRDEGPRRIVKSARGKPKYPARNDDGEPEQGAALICIQHTMEGVRPCQRGSSCNYAHLDGDGAAREPTRYAALRIFLTKPELVGKIVWTAEGKRVAGIS